ncbi:MAG: HAMP domain-containing histidine kinase [Myxococcales bacterium]|nr:HAMP domain-containing histidine kinase [Myxococcales bacterium]
MSLRRLFSPLLLIISAIIVAAVVLAYYSYRSADKLAERSERSVGTSNRLLGRKLIDRIEKVIIDNDRTFFNLVNLDDPREFVELWRRIVRVSAAVESVIVLDREHTLKHLITKLGHKQSGWFKHVFQTQLVKKMHLDRLPRDSHKHLHTSYAGQTYLLSYIRRERYSIVLSVNIPYLIKDIFKEEFSDVGESRTIAVMDEGGRVLYGHPVATEGTKLVFEERFPTTLYKWRLQIAPLDVKALRRQAEQRRMIDMVLVGAAVAVIVVGLIVMLIAVRKERRANELKSDFIANVSHELKTPLSLIRMFGELLSLGRASKPETQREYAEIITRESDRLTSLIDNVLDFARIERGKVAYEFQRGDVRGAVERAVELSRYRYEQAGVELTLSLDEDLPEIEFDGSAMTLLVLNLLENALKYGASKDGEVRVELHHRDGVIALRVADDGPGIPAEEHKRIFDRFFRGREPRRSSTRGSGIGLSLVKHIAEAHGGSVSLNSELGKGATFAVSIPCHDAS